MSKKRPIAARASTGRGMSAINHKDDLCAKKTRAESLSLGLGLDLSLELADSI